jgi:hypothetical protein
MNTIPATILPTLSDEQIHKYGYIDQLVDFPHVAARIELMWGTRDCRKYLYSLTVEDFARKPPRRGFPFAALDAVVSLLELHDTIYPQFAPIIKSWEQSTF